MFVAGIYSHVVATSLSDVLILGLKTRQGWPGWLVAFARLNATIFGHRNRGITPEWSDKKTISSYHHLHVLLQSILNSVFIPLKQLTYFTCYHCQQSQWFIQIETEVITSFAVNMIALSSRHNVHWTHLENWRKWHKAPILITEYHLIEFSK